MDTSSVFTRVLPVTRRCRVLRISTVSSWSLPNALALGAEHAHHFARERLHAQLLAHRVAAANSSRRMVAPIRHTAPRRAVRGR